MIVRAGGVPLYHFVVVVDDEKMEISHVIRGEDHLSNTPKHIALIRALGYTEPRFGHIPLILNAGSVEDEQAQVPDRDDRLSRAGLPAGGDGQLPGLPGLVAGHRGGDLQPGRAGQRFEIANVHKAGAVFDPDRLDYLNGVYIRSLTDEQLALRLRPFLPDALDDDAVLRVVPLIKERLVRLGDADELVAFLYETDEQVIAGYQPSTLEPKGRSLGEVATALAARRGP